MNSTRLSIVIFVLSTVCLRAQLAWQPDVLEFHPDINATEVKAEFPFTNIGSKPITIKEIKPACGCTTATIEKMTYAPGEKGVIKAIYSVHSSVGYQEKQIAITTDDNTSKILTIKAYIPEIASIVPSNVTWNVGDSDDGKNVSVKIVYDKPVTVLGIECTTDRVYAKLKTITKDKDYLVTLTPISTADPVLGGVVVKVILKDGNVPKMFFIPFRIAAPTAATL